jgi:arylsulfatase A-like enzyme
MHRFFLIFLFCIPAFAQKRPNILWIMAEDLSPELSCYGSKLNAGKTPALDQMAKDGLLLRQCFAPAPVCSATRSAMLTGAMQTTSGMHNHRSSRTESDAIHLPQGWSTLPELMQQAGYVCFNIGKDDYNFRYDRSKLYNLGGTDTKNPKAKRDNGGQSFDWIKLVKEGNKPFFGQFQITGGKWVGNEKRLSKLTSRTNPADVIVPPYFPDIPEIRKCFALHADAARVTDEDVAAIFKELRDGGLLENTVVIFMSDHGMENSPRHKQFCYEGGLHVPCIIRFPQTFRPIPAASIDESLVSLIDITATTLAITGASRPAWFEGRNLLDSKQKAPQYLRAARDRLDWSLDTIRSIRSQQYRYIRNYQAQRPYMQSQYRDGKDYMNELRRLMAAGALDKQPGGFFLPTKAEEELYDLRKDSHQVNNLAKDPASQEILAQHRAALAEWQQSLGDRHDEKESDAALRVVIKDWPKQATDPVYQALK